MPQAPYPLPPLDPAIDQVAAVLDPIVTPIGFAPGQAGMSESEGQVIFCRGSEGSADGGCIDLVIDLRAAPGWRITDVRYWGFPPDRWHLPFPRHADLPAQLAQLARTLPTSL